MIIAALALATAHQAAAVSPRVASRRSVGDACVIEIVTPGQRQLVTVSWSPCEELSIRTMSVAELASAGQLDSLTVDQRNRCCRSPSNRVVTAWGEFAAVIYIPNGRRFEEVSISD